MPLSYAVLNHILIKNEGVSPIGVGLSGTLSATLRSNNTYYPLRKKIREYPRNPPNPRSIYFSNKPSKVKTQQSHKTNILFLMEQAEATDLIFYQYVVLTGQKYHVQQPR